MNRTEFIKELSEKLNLSENKAKEINKILESNLLIGKKNKDKIISELKDKLKLNEKDADKIYNEISKIITKEIKNKLKNPFKSKD